MVSTATEMAVPPQQQQQQQQLQQAPAKPKVKKSAAAHSNAAGAGAKGRNVVDRKPPDPLELEMARQDLFKIANPDTQTPFTSLEDACDRLLPYHVLAEYELDETEEKDGEILSKHQVWEETLNKRTEEFMATMERQLKLYNEIMKKLSEGGMRAEERMMVEQSLLVEERQKLATVRAQIEAKEKEEREAAEAKAKEAVALAERARVEAQARAEAQARIEAAQAEAQKTADALRAEADSITNAEPQTRLETNSNAGPAAPEAVGMAGIARSDAGGGWAPLDEQDDDDGEDDDESEGDEGDEGDEEEEEEEEDEDLEEVLEDEEDDEEEDDESADDDDGTGGGGMVPDYNKVPSIQERLSKPS